MTVLLASATIAQRCGYLVFGIAGFLLVLKFRPAGRLIQAMIVKTNAPRPQPERPSGSGPARTR